MLHIPEESPERLTRTAQSAKRRLRHLLSRWETCRTEAQAAVSVSDRAIAEMRLHSVERLIARQALRRQEAEDRLTAIEALADCSHTRPHERPRTHRRIEAPELWR